MCPVAVLLCNKVIVSYFDPFKGTKYITEINKGITGSREYAEATSLNQCSWKVFINGSSVVCNWAVNFSDGVKIFFSNFPGIVMGRVRNAVQHLVYVLLGYDLHAFFFFLVRMHIVERPHLSNVLQLNRTV